MKHVKLYEDFIPPRYERNEPSQETLNHIYDIERNGKRLFTYLHTTNEDVCKNVLKNGFEFYEFFKTTDEISNSIDIFNYKLGIRGSYGKYTIVIQILNPITDGEDVTIKDPFVGEDGDLIFTLSPTHIRGYFNNETFDFVENPNFKLS